MTSVAVVENDKLLSASAVMDRLKVSRFILTGWITRKIFPQHTTFVDGMPRWSERVVDDWIRTCPKKERPSRARGAR